MHKNGYLEDIQDLNLSYLLLVQRLLNEDRETAMFRLNLDAEMADAIAGLSIKQLTQLSRTNQLLCHLRFSDARQLDLLLNNPRAQGLSQTHAALLMAGANRIALPSSQEG
ncbi:flagellar transcriptional regulator FlhD [Salinicola sp. JS01]|uniref:flagellar transcriptional regulator FlhD n=1 Tax=Salinicola sp. JS01 TaxID=3050071 RepID=UPI0004E79DDD|nr:flagellar transcriptional regulator FlhD [Salinicola sp. JS01]KFF49811.1 transcriptional regulator [Gammaproteobacteria bacterium MFB021]WIX34794.1 flagellar transcriptional regulator FlhD [Salinicola sp. JS01]